MSINVKREVFIFYISLILASFVINLLIINGFSININLMTSECNSNYIYIIAKIIWTRTKQYIFIRCIYEILDDNLYDYLIAFIIAIAVALIECIDIYSGINIMSTMVKTALIILGYYNAAKKSGVQSYIIFVISLFFEIMLINFFC